MRDFAAIEAIAAERKGGSRALAALLRQPLAPADVAATSDDRWLSTMAKCLFQAGFHWRVIEAKWPGFEAAFDGFDPRRVAFMHDEDVERLMTDTRVVRNGAKLKAVIENARFIGELAREHGSAAAFFAHWPADDQLGLTTVMTKRGARLGGGTGQRVLRAMGRDGYILSPDVLARLGAEGIVTKDPPPKAELRAVQAAINQWAAQSGRCLTHISQILAFSV